ncbi:hypothetical protein ACLB1Q_05445 [Escherichia coli]
MLQGERWVIQGLNARYNALTSVSPNAEVSLDKTDVGVRQRKYCQ